MFYESSLQIIHMASKKKSQNLYMIIMSFGMSVIMCAVVTAAGTGIHDGYIERFFKAWVFAFPVAVLAAFTMAPIAKKLVDKITK